VAIYPEEEQPILVVEEGGFHAAEALILARYMMFTQVYFHHTRRAYDHHAVQAIKTILEKYSNGFFPSPATKEDIQEYVKWDDWRVTGCIQAGEAGEQGEIILNRKHHRAVYSTSETPDEDELEKVEDLTEHLGDMVAFVDKAEKSWYKFEAEDIYILPDSQESHLLKLSALSSAIRGLQPVSQLRIYVPLEKREEALEKVNDFNRGG
jgi:HD superfamily phosphohydrolase